MALYAGLAVCALVSAWRGYSDGAAVSVAAMAPRRGSNQRDLENAASDARMHPKRSVAAAQRAALPSPSAPLSQTYDALVDLAHAGNAEAAYRLADGLAACLQLGGADMDIAEWNRRLDQLAAQGDRADDSVEELRAKLLDLRSERDSLYAKRGDRAAQSFRDIHHWLDLAAHLGSPQAQFDYATNPWINPMAAIAEVDAWQDWRDRARTYLDSSLRAGDPRAALAMAVASTDAPCGADADMGSEACGQSQLIYYILPHDPEMAYRYYLLDQLLGDSANAGWVQPRVDALAQNLTPDQVADARAWAQAIFAQATSPDTAQ